MFGPRWEAVSGTTDWISVVTQNVEVLVIPLLRLVDFVFSVVCSYFCTPGLSCTLVRAHVKVDDSSDFIIIWHPH